MKNILIKLLSNVMKYVTITINAIIIFTLNTIKSIKVLVVKSMDFLATKFKNLYSDIKNTSNAETFKDLMIVHKFTTIFLTTMVMLFAVISIDTRIQYQTLNAEAQTMGVNYEVGVFVKPNTIIELDRLNEMTKEELEAVVDNKLVYASQIGLEIESELVGMDLIDQPAYIDMKIQEQEALLAHEAQLKVEEEMRIAEENARLAAEEEARLSAERAETERIAQQQAEEQASEDARNAELARQAEVKKSYSGGSVDEWIAPLGLSESEASFAKYIIYKESGGNPYAGNVDGPYGLCQANPGYKMASAGSDWETNPYTQAKWCNTYAKSRYGSWEGAYIFWTENMYF
jgi:hypothetical protein